MVVFLCVSALGCIKVSGYALVKVLHLFLAQRQCALDPPAHRQAESSDPSLPAAIQLRIVEFGPLTPPQGWEERSAPSAHAATEETKQQRELRHCEFVAEWKECVFFCHLTSLKLVFLFLSRLKCQTSISRVVSRSIKFPGIAKGPSSSSPSNSGHYHSPHSSGGSSGVAGITQNSHNRSGLNKHRWMLSYPETKAARHFTLTDLFH